MIKDTSAQDEVIVGRKSHTGKVLVALAMVTAAILVAYIFTGQSDVGQSIDKASVQISQVELGDLTRDIIANGRIVAANAPQIYSPEQGVVSLIVKAGDHVQEGQIVATLESPELENQLKQQTSEMQRLQGELAKQGLESRSQALQLNKQLELSAVDLEAAMRENRRAQAAIKNNLISQIDHEKAVDDLARATLTHKHAEQELDISKDKLSFELDSLRSTAQRQALVVDELNRKIAALNITASVTGVVGNLLVQANAFVSKNDALMTLVDLSAYEVELSVVESYANDIGLGMPVEITVAGETIMGTLASISPEINNRQVMTRVRFDQQGNAKIRQNQQVSARILLENKTHVLKVRRGSFLQAGGFVAYKVDNDIATKIDIQIGATSMREVEILTGLKVNDQIIISNYESFIKSDTVLLN